MRIPSINNGLRRIILLVLALLLVLLGSLLISKKNSQQKYNLVIISIDTLRSDHMSLYGYPQKTTPNIDSWAEKNGVTFTNAYTQIPITYPSFVSTMTGLSPFQTGIYNNGKVEDDDGRLLHADIPGNRPIDPSDATLADILHSTGYRTGAFVINNILGAKYSGLNKGFDTYNIVGDNYKISGIDQFVGDVLSWLGKKQTPAQPFFLWVHFLDPHEPFTPTRDNECRFAGLYCTNLKAHTIKYFTNQEKKLQGCTTTPLPPRIISTQEALYDAELYQTDKNVGKILDYLHNQQLDKHTIIVFFADHGEGFDHNYNFTHQEVLYESSLKIPYVIATPETLENPKKENALLDNTETLSTLLSLLHLENRIPSGQTGFSQLVTGDSQASYTKDTEYYMNAMGNKFAIRKGNMKYILTNLVKGSQCIAQETEELYDLSKDPHERVNLIATQPDLAQKLRTSLQEHITQSKLLYNTSVDEINQHISSSSATTDEHEQEILRNLKSLGY